MSTTYLLLFLFSLSSVFADDLIVNTLYGDVEGHYQSDGQVREFMGIPFASPPVGELRFAAPENADSWTGTYVADFINPGCPQECTLPPGTCPLTTSEDCLYLNIWAPTNIPDGVQLPVYVWIHGGAFTVGNSNCALYNGTNLAATNNIIVVSMNYRLGVFGFLASDIFGGNFGILDQRLAMQWVNDNIESFGGNKNEITIGGQSAGAMSVLCHLTSSGSQGLFQQAIMESNPFSIEYHTRTAATELVGYIGDYIGCDPDDVACFRSASVASLLAAGDDASTHYNFKIISYDFLPFGPVVEDSSSGSGEDDSTGFNMLSDQPFNLYRQGLIPEMPILIGTVSEDGRLFVYEMFSSPLSRLEYDSALLVVFGKKYFEVLAMYPADLLNNTADTRDVLSLLTTDLLFLCPLRNSSREVLNRQNTNIFPYYFTHVMSFDGWGPNYSFCVGHVCHSSEIPFIFDQFSDGTISYDITSDEELLTQNMMAFWGNFINYGNPNIQGSNDWVSYSASVDQLIVLEQPLSELFQYRSDYCDFWDAQGYFY
jgi:carboxylesterase type B